MDKKEYNKQYREKHRAEFNAKSKLYYQEHREEVKDKARERARKHRREAPDEIRERDRLVMRAWRLKCKVTVLSHYGLNGKLICVRCGEDRLSCLSLDHIDGSGRKDRRERGNLSSIYFPLIKEGFPVGFQTLCMNCQWIKRFENNENR